MTIVEPIDVDADDTVEALNLLSEAISALERPTDSTLEFVECRGNLRPILTFNEDIILHNIDIFEWICRDPDGTLMLFKTKPSKTKWGWVSNNLDMCSLSCFQRQFHFIKWSDIEPWNIKELLSSRCEVIENGTTIDTVAEEVLQAL